MIEWPRYQNITLRAYQKDGGAWQAEYTIRRSTGLIFGWGNPGFRSLEDALKDAIFGSDSGINPADKEDLMAHARKTMSYLFEEKARPTLMKTAPVEYHHQVEFVF